MPALLEPWVCRFTSDDVQAVEAAVQRMRSRSYTKADYRFDPNTQTAEGSYRMQVREFLAEWAGHVMFGVPFDLAKIGRGSDGGIDFWCDGRAFDVKWTHYTSKQTALIIPVECRTLDNDDTVIVWCLDELPRKSTAPVYRTHGVISIRRFLSLALDAVRQHLKPMNDFNNIEPKGAPYERVAPNTSASECAIF